MGHAYVMLIGFILVLIAGVLWRSPVRARLVASWGEAASHTELTVALLFDAVRIRVPFPTRSSGSDPVRTPLLDGGAAARHLLKGSGVHVDYFRVRAAFGLEDAALTAMACGVSYAMVGGMTAWLAGFVRFSRAPDILILPRYDRFSSAWTVSCILRTSLGHLMGALAVGLWAQLRRRGVVAWFPRGIKGVGHIRSRV